MFRPSSSRSGLSCSGRSKESSSSGSRSSRSGVSTRGRSPRRSPSPRGRRRLSPSSSRSSRRSPSPRRTSRVRSPSGGSQTRRGSEQRDGSLSRRISLGRHSRFACRHSPSRHSESSEEQSLQTAASNERYSIDLLERRRLSDRLGSPVDSLSDVDRDDFTDYPVFSRCLSYHQSLERYSSPERSPPSSFNRRYNKDYHSKDVSLYQLDFDMSYDHLQDISRETDRDIKLHRKHLHSPEKRGRDPKRHPCDREDRQLDVSMDPQGFLPGKQNYYKRNLSRSPSPACSDEDFKEVENSETKRSTCQDMSSSGSVIHGLTNSVQSPEPQFLHRPEKAPALPKKSVLKNRVDEPSLQVNNFLKFSNKNTIAKSANKEYQASVDNWRVFSGVQQNTFHSEQNFKSFLRQKDYQESMSESADLHDDFLLPHERAIQDGSGFLRILDRMVDSSNIQEQRRCSFLDVENEEKFLYDDDEDDANIKYPSTENLTMDSWKESLSLNPRSLSPIKSIEPNTSDGSRIEYEKISDLLKAIGLDIGVSEIGKGAARTEERLHGKKTLRSLDGLSVISHKPDSNEKDCIQSISHSPESSQKNSLSPCGSFQPSNDTSSVSISEHTKSKTLGNNNSGGSSEQSFPPVSATVSAPPSLPILPLPTPLISQYPVSHFSAFTTAQLLPNHPPPTMAPPIYNAYGHYMAYSASAWPMYTPPLRQSNPALSGVNGLVSVTMPPKPIRSNLRIIETVSTVKKNPGKKINKSVLLKIPITPNSRLRSQSSVGGTTERISERNPASEMPKVTEEDKLVSKKEAWQKKLQFLKTELDRRSKQQLQMLCNKCKKKDPLLAEVNRVQENIVKEIAQLQTESRIAETKHSQFEKISHVIKILEMPCKKASENADSLEEEKSDNTKTQENTSNSVKVMDDKEKLRAEQETRKRKLQDLKSELSRLSGQGGQILRNKNIKYKVVLLAELEHTQQKILNEINQLQLETETVEKTQSELDKDCLNKNPVCDEWRNLDHQAGLSLLQETDCNLKRKWCRKEKEDRDERSAKMARKEESAITNELREEVSENEINKGEEDSHGQKLIIKLVLKKDDRKVEKEGEKEEYQKELSKLSSEKCSLRKTEIDNQSQDQDVAAPKYQSVDEGQHRESKSQSGNPDSKQKFTVAEAENLGMMMTKEQKMARTAQMSQQFKRFDSPHCPILLQPPGPLLSWISSSALDKPAPTKTSGIKSSDASTKLPPVLKKGNNPELGPFPCITKAFGGGAVILKATQENIKLQEEVEAPVQVPESVSDIMEHAKAQRQEVTESKAGKHGSAEDQVVLKIAKMKQELHIFQKSHPPPLIPDPPLLLSLPLEALLSFAPALPCPPRPLFPLVVSGPANQGHSVCTHHYLKRRDKRMTGILPSRNFSICQGFIPYPLMGQEPSFHMGIGRAEEPGLDQGGLFGCLQTQLLAQPRHLHEARNSALPELFCMPLPLPLTHLGRRAHTPNQS